MIYLQKIKIYWWFSVISDTQLAIIIQVVVDVVTNKSNSLLNAPAGVEDTDHEVDTSFIWNVIGEREVDGTLKKILL